MKWITLLACIVIAGTSAAGDNLSDNPAFCFGFILALSPADAEDLQQRSPQIQALHARIGPKDSTDERNFADWQKIGTDVAADPVDKMRTQRLKYCRLLSNSGPK